MKSSVALPASPKRVCAKHGVDGRCDCETFDLSRHVERDLFVIKQQDVLYGWGLKWHFAMLLISLATGFVFPKAGGLYGHLLFGLVCYIPVLAVTLALLPLAKRHREKKQIKQAAQLIADPAFMDVRLEKSRERALRREQKRREREAARLRRYENNAKHSNKIDYSDYA